MTDLEDNSDDELKVMAHLLAQRRDQAVMSVIGCEIALDQIRDEMNRRKNV